MFELLTGEPMKVLQYVNCEDCEQLTKDIADKYASASTEKEKWQMAEAKPEAKPFQKLRRY